MEMNLLQEVVCVFLRDGVERVLTMTYLNSATYSKNKKLELNTNINSKGKEKKQHTKTQSIVDDNSIEDSVDDDFEFLEEVFNSDLDAIINSPEFIERANNSIRVPDFKDNKEYIEIYQRDRDKREYALDLLVHSNQKLVFSIVKKYKRYQNQSFTEDDMFQHGMIGLITAAKKFDLSLGTEFSTYAVFWIRQEISRAIFDQSNTVRIPVHMNERIQKVRMYESKSFQKYGFIDYEWIAMETNIELDKVNEAVLVSNTFQSNLSLDLPIGTDESTLLAELIEDPSRIYPESLVIQKSITNILYEQINELKDRERDILIQRFGLDGNPPRTLEEIGRTMKVTRERIRQIESIALGRLRYINRYTTLSEDYKGMIN